MIPSFVYFAACVLGAVGLYLIMRPLGRGMGMVGTLAAIAGFGWLAGQVLETTNNEGEVGSIFTVSIFAATAIAGAVRMITTSRPVYSALYFVLVVLSSAALFLLLEAEFMAFALIIVYAGAILITYMFVLMLAQQAPETGDESAGAYYDRYPREPLAAVFVGFLMLAVLGNVLFGVERGDTISAQRAYAEQWMALDETPAKRNEIIRDLAPDMRSLVAVEDPVTGINRSVYLEDGQAYVDVYLEDESQPTRLALPEDALPENTELVGLALVAKFPASLELAGVILLMAMFGAVVLARRQIELGEDERRDAAGVRRLSADKSDQGGQS